MNYMFNINNKLSKANTNAGIEIDLGINSRTSYRPGLKADFEPDFDLNNADEVDLISRVIATETDKS